MSKLIGVLLIALLIYGGWELFLLWDKYSTDKDLAEKQATSNQIVPEQLAGMPVKPAGLEKSYEAARKNGATGVRNWLKAWGAKVEDPRRAWIELDYVILISHEDPVEAKKVFADVKARTPENSPVFGRIKELQKTYE